MGLAFSGFECNVLDEAVRSLSSAALTGTLPVQHSAAGIVF